MSLDRVETFPSPLVAVVGALELQRTPRGVRPRRLPAWTAPQVPTPTLDFVLRMTSGVRLAFTTTATEIALDVDVFDPRGTTAAPPVFELVVDGEPHSRRVLPPSAVTPVDGDAPAREPVAPPATVSWTGLDPAPKRIELWLPQTVACELRALRTDADLARAHDDRPRWVHHGSSISQGGEADGPLGTWPVVAARRVGLDVLNLGFSGNAVGDPFVARTIRDLPADVISLEIGINIVNGDVMRRRAFGPVLHGFLDTVRDGHPHTPLLLIGPIPCPAVEHRPGPTLTDHAAGTTVGTGDPRGLLAGALSLDGIREVIDDVLRARSDDPHLHHLDGRLLLRPEETADLEDGLHPGAPALRRMGERFADLALRAGGALALPGA